MKHYYLNDYTTTDLQILRGSCYLLEIINAKVALKFLKCNKLYLNSLKAHCNSTFFLLVCLFYLLPTYLNDIYCLFSS